MDETLKKMLQKKVYDLLSHKYGILLLLAGAVLITTSALHFGEAWLEWSQEKYEAVFNSFSDNIAGKSFRDRLTVPLPIDVVYTWVNGSDPALTRELELVKVSLEEKNNMTRKQVENREERCTFTNCIPVGVLLYPPLHSSVSAADIIAVDAMFINVTGLKEIKERNDWPANFTLLTLEQEAHAKYILKHTAHGWTYLGTNHTVKPAFYTSDVNLPHGLLVPETIMMSGFPSQYSEGDIQQTIASRLNMTDKTSIPVTLHKDKGLALLHISLKTNFDLLTKAKNFTIEHKIQRLSQVKLVWDLRFAVKDDVVASNRFEDNEELRYSLRSLERFAPWVRHIYIVTNGQIPYWLNLDSPRVTVITHEEIFQNTSYLPTFSSPGIEANIHRIPGLSDKFLYLNDDVMFGSPVWPDDFYTHATGQKLYLTWPVPNCNDGCPSTWIRDGYCDKACNSSECDWDGGDCLGAKGRVQLGAGFHDSGSRFSDYTSYCNTGCANNWLADKYCDQACNNLQCGFDLGDCGVSNYDKLYGLTLSTEKRHYSLPAGEIMGYFNLSTILSNKDKVTSASFGANAAVRAVAVGNKYKVLTLILNKGQNATKLEFELQYKIGENQTGKLNFTLQVDTSVEKPTAAAVLAENKTAGPTVKLDDALDLEAFTGHPEGPRIPKPAEAAATLDLEQLNSVRLDQDVLDFYKEVQMSPELKQELSLLDRSRQEGELTDIGLKVKFYEILWHFGDELQNLKHLFQEQRMKATLRQLEEEELNRKQNATDVKSPGLKLKNDSLLNIVSYQHEENKRSQSVDGQPALFHIGSEKDKLPDQIQILNAKTDEPQNINLHNKSDILQQSVRVNSRSVKKNPKLGDYNPREYYDKSKFASNWFNRSRLDLIGKNRTVGGDVDSYQTKTEPRRRLLTIMYWNSLEEQMERQRLKMEEDKLGEQMSDEEFLRLVNIDSARENVDGFPWERKDGKTQAEDSRELGRKANEYTVEGWQGRQLLDTFGDSLRHVNHIYNREFGFQPRKVPGHMPHMIDKNIMFELQARFPKEWDATSAHKIRSSTDMQYAFAYYYYLMGVTEPVTATDVFNQMDTDHSETLSDREIRTLAARMYDLPLYLETLTGLENMFVNCSQHLSDPTQLSEDKLEHYYDKSMPQVTKYLFINCESIIQLVKSRVKPKLKYKTITMDDSDITFKMIHSNVSHVVGQLDDIRKHPKKFICLNDNIDHSIEEAKTVKAILQDFYESLLPIQSQFELPRDYRNRFLHMRDLREWRTYRDRLRFWTHVALVVLVILALLSFLGDKIENIRRNWLNRKRRRRRPSSSYDSTPPTSVDVTPSPDTADIPGRFSVWDTVVETV
ncbi:N-acetylglucosamine-1-phosphotransferase subunits alpha/beta-like [Physella acuta]|uniref:N-acetylglucosamine-1-phosphotransferase subunits alpha/beta-like n=1 Tax=Physella acuta TaxID=109671 RepID=UPI0027DCAE2C|nr:N-acetylglucosamine-1-phosphotransferase subunits alpha/beta-like [Physella acuta]